MPNNPWDLEKSGPATVAEVVVPLDSVDLTNPSRALFVGATGNLKVTMFGGQDVTFFNVQGGQVYPYAVTKVFSGDTTCGSMVALR